ncbi:hypothetical protein JFK57_17110 [Escherichia coli]|nr:hypothetical protein [Escherichia coli]
MLMKLVFCSTAHLEKQDAFTLKDIASGGESYPWVFDTMYGYILDTGSMRHPLLKMKAAGLSRPMRKFVYHMQRKHNAKYIHFDCDASPVEGEETFDW